jgi:hypothetical protein
MITQALKLYWNAERGDNFCTATAQGEQDARSAGYPFVRVEGFILPNPEPGTVPLKLYWSAARGDNCCAASAQTEHDALASGYMFVRVEGYVYPAVAPITANWKHFRDTIVINTDFANFVAAKANALPKGSTLLIAARDCRHDPGTILSVPGYHLILLADQYDSAGGAIDASGLSALGQGANGAPGKAGIGDEPGEPGGQGESGPAGNSGGNIILFAKRLINARVLSSGGHGGQGGTGGTGGPPHSYQDPDRGGTVWSAPGPGGNGGAGGHGGNGGRSSVVCVELPDTTPGVQLEANGGDGASGGAGGRGAMDHQGRFQAPSGAAGPRGARGLPGWSSISQMTEDEYWMCLRYAVGSDASEWATYRLSVGEYVFRAYRAASPYDTYQGLALDEFDAALALNPDFVQARTDRDHLLGNRNILGIPRQVDIFPDFERYDSFVTASAQLVLSILQFASNDLTTGILANYTVQSLQREIDHLKSSKKILSDEEKAAALGKTTADQEESIAEQRANQVAAQVQAKKLELDQAYIDYMNLAVSTVGTVAGIVAAIPTGGASVLAVTPAVISLYSDLETSGVLTEMKGALHLGGEEAEKAWAKLETDAGSLKTIIEQNFAAAKNLVNLVKTLDDVWQAKVAKKEYQELLAKSVEAVHALLLARQRASQAEILHQVAVAKQVQRDADEQAATAQLNRINAGIKVLNDAAKTIIHTSHSYFDTVARFAFYVARALEIYTLDDQSSEIHYDYGYVHPDIDQDYLEGRLLSEKYVAAYQATWSSVPDLMHFRQRYLDYFASSNSDFTRDIYVRLIAEPAALADFKQHRTLSVSIDFADLQQGRAEAKAEVVAVALIGATSQSAIINCRVEHGGISKQKKRDGNVVIQYLRPHSTIVHAELQPLAPNDLIPDPRTDPLIAPRTVAFWGRGVATTWRLTVEDPTVDLSTVSAIQVGIGYVAFLI